MHKKNKTPKELVVAYLNSIGATITNVTKHNVIFLLPDGKKVTVSI